MAPKIGRPKTTDKNRREVLVEKALELFKTYGIRKVSVEEICARAEVSKVTFYKYFDNKEALTEAALEKLYEAGYQDWNRIRSMRGAFLKKIEMLIDLKLAKTREYGEALVNDVLHVQEPRLVRYIEGHQKKLMRETLEFFRNGQEEGALNPDFPPEFFLYLIDQVNRMVRDPGLEKIIPTTHVRTKLLLDNFFYGIMRRKEASR